MIAALKIFFVLVLMIMTLGTVRASLDRGVMTAIRDLGPDPWFQVTLLDTYFAFLTFFLWVAYKERGMAAKAGWLLGILLLGNFAMAAYMLLQLSRLKQGEGMRQLLLREEDA